MKKTKKHFINFILNILPYIIGSGIGIFILWKVLIKPLVETISIQDIIAFTLLISILTVVWLISDNIIESLIKSKDSNKN